MATQPTNLPVPSESPRDLKFNAGKIDEFVTSLVNTYVDRFGNEHYTIEGLRWLAQQAIAQYGWIPVGTFQAGATLTLPNQILKDTTDGEYYRWDGVFLPSGKVVPNGSTPETTGGVGVGAWISVGDSTLRALLASVEGAKNIGNGQSTVDQFLYHTPEEFYTGSMDAAFSESFDATISDGKPTWNKGTKNLLSALTLNDGATLKNDGVISSAENGNLPIIWLGNDSQVVGGKLISNGRAQALRAESKNNIKVREVTAETSAITSAGLPAYALDFYDCTDIDISEVDSSGYTGGVELLGTRRARAKSLRFKNMKYHPALTAGGYGVIIGGSRDNIIGDMFFKAGTDGYGRHGLYLVVRNGVACQNTIFSQAIMDYTDHPVGVIPPGGINIRSNARAIYEGFIIDGSRVTTNAQEGDISAQIITNGIVNSLKQTASPAYGLGLESQGTNLFRNSIVSNCIVSVNPNPLTTVDNQLCYSLVVSGKNNNYFGINTNVPDLSYPVYIKDGAAECMISTIEDVGPSPGNGVAFVLFEGAAARIKISGCHTNRPWFRTGNLDNVTDLTVDWPRLAVVAVNAGVVTYVDSNQRINSTAVSATNIVITFKNHVTTAAINAAVASLSTAATLVHPVITARSGKTLTIAFYNFAGNLVNPSTANGAVQITLNC